MKGNAGSVLLLALGGCATTGATTDRDPFGPDFVFVHKTTPQASISGELGSETNPVRVLMPAGEQAYLHRLRCENGAPPKFNRKGSGGIGPYGKIIDYFDVECDATGKRAIVVMDMYHCIEEERAVPGFDIVPEIEPRSKDECN
jgi:hypothetical protein